MLDGVPQTDPFGGWVNWPAYDPSDLAGIRVVRGGGSVANGPGALAGTIEMTSRADAGVIGRDRRRQPPLGRRAARVSGSRRRRYVLSLSGQGGRSDGFVPITEDNARSCRRASGLITNGMAARDGSLRSATSTELQASIYPDSTTGGRAARTSRPNRTNGADASVRLVSHGRWQWSALGYWQWRNLMSSFANVSPGRVTATRCRCRIRCRRMGSAEASNCGRRCRKVSSCGSVPMRGAPRESRELFTYVAGNPTRRRFAGGDTFTGGAFAEATADVGRLTLTGGARLDHWQVTDGHLFEKVIATNAVLRDDKDPKRDGWLPTARGGAVVKWDNGLSLRTAAYLGWRMPTLNELFRPFRAGLDATAANPDLDPEKLVGAEIRRRI